MTLSNYRGKKIHHIIIFSVNKQSICELKRNRRNTQIIFFFAFLLSRETVEALLCAMKEGDLSYEVL